MGVRQGDNLSPLLFNIFLSDLKSYLGNKYNGLSNIHDIATDIISHDFFPCEMGVRQGDNLSPLLFNIFLSDLKSYLGNKYNGLSNIHDIATDIISVAISWIFDRPLYLFPK